MRRDQEYVGRKMMEMKLLGKRKKGRPKKRFLDVVKEDMGKVGAKETDVEDRKVWRMMIRCGHPWLKGKAEIRSFLNCVLQHISVSLVVQWCVTNWT